MHACMYVCMLKINLPVNKVTCLLDKTYHHTCVYQHWGWTQHCSRTCRSWLWWSSCVRSHWYHWHTDLKNDKEQTEFIMGDWLIVNTNNLRNFMSILVCMYVCTYVHSYSSCPYLYACTYTQFPLILPFPHSFPPFTLPLANTWHVLLTSHSTITSTYSHSSYNFSPFFSPPLPSLHSPP